MTDPGGRIRVLATSKAYLPGFRSGGPIRTLAGLAHHLGDRIDLAIFTLDRDAGEPRPYEGVTLDRWQRRGRARVFYASPAAQRLASLRRVVREHGPDLLYLNSLFHPVVTVRVLLLRRLGLLPNVPVVLAPRGELAASALGVKRLKKRLFLAVARALGLYRNVLWQASTPAEADDILRAMGPGVDIVVARNLVASPDPGARRPEPVAKEPGRLRVVVLARVAPVKNLLFAVERLAGLRGEVEVDIYGPMVDEVYWDRCRTAIARLPAHVRVAWHGAVPHPEVPGILAEHHLFLLPTLGENFGHGILEALQAGVPVLISDRTPWRGLEEAGAGWDLPLEDPGAFHDALQACVGMDAAAWARMSRSARSFGRSHAHDDEAVRQNERLFRRAVDRPRAS